MTDFEPAVSCKEAEQRWISLAEEALRGVATRCHVARYSSPEANPDFSDVTKVDVCSGRVRDGEDVVVYFIYANLSKPSLSVHFFIQGWNVTKLFTKESDPFTAFLQYLESFNMDSVMDLWHSVRKTRKQQRFDFLKELLPALNRLRNASNLEPFEVTSASSHVLTTGTTPNTNLPFTLSLSFIGLNERPMLSITVGETTISQGYDFEDLAALTSVLEAAVDPAWVEAEFASLQKNPPKSEFDHLYDAISLRKED